MGGGHYPRQEDRAKGGVQDQTHWRGEEPRYQEGPYPQTPCEIRNRGTETEAGEEAKETKDHQAEEISDTGESLHCGGMGSQGEEGGVPQAARFRSLFSHRSILSEPLPNQKNKSALSHGNHHRCRHQQSEDPRASLRKPRIMRISSHPHRRSTFHQSRGCMTPR